MTRCPTCGDPRGSADCERCGAMKDDPLPGRGHGPVGLILTGLVRGGQSPLDGQWLQHYDPREPGTDPDGQPMTATVVTTDDPALALRFINFSAARREWMRWDGSVRPDGQPSRPLTAFNISLKRLPTSESDASGNRDEPD